MHNSRIGTPRDRKSQGKGDKKKKKESPSEEVESSESGSNAENTEDEEEKAKEDFIAATEEWLCTRKLFALFF